MERHTTRTILIFAAVVIAAISVYPTLGWLTLSEDERQTRLAAWSEEDNSRTEPNFWKDSLSTVRRWSQFDRSRVINLGLDLQGGLHMVIGFEMTPEAEERGMDEALIQDLILQRIRNRINEFEAREPIIQKLGKNQVQVQLPGVKDIQRAKDLIMKTAYLTFHMVSGPDETTNILRTIDRHFNNGFVPFLDRPFRRGGAYQVSQKNLERIERLIQEAMAVPGLVPEDKMIALSTPPAPWEERGYSLYIMDREPPMNGEGLKSAVAAPDNQSPGNWQILFEFGTDSAREFADLTEANKGRDMAIALDGRVVSAPTINERIFGSGQISGSFTAEEARDLAIALNSGSMPVPVKEDYTGVVGASLGADSVKKGITSSLMGLAMVMVFMLVYYRMGGLIANAALAVNALLIMGAFAYFNATLTLPGIAGLILTIGMAVDANVLIFERIREELRNGKSLASSVEGGYEHATMTILDANITTLIAAVVLTQFGSGPVQGFAIALSIGVCTSVFAALVVTRALLDFFVGRKILKKLVMMSILRSEPKFKFIEKRRLAATMSCIAIAIGLTIFGMRGSGNFGVDFTNGTNMIVALTAQGEVAVGDVREQLIEAGFDSPTVQKYDEGGRGESNKFVIRLGGADDDADASPVGATEPQEGAGEESTAEVAVVDLTPTATISSRVQSALILLCTDPLAQNINDQVVLEKVETVGPAVGAKLQRDAVLAISYALIFIVAYLWFRFELRFALAAVVALVHDVLIVVGLFALTGREITIPVVAALLTIIGYSLNDTIVVFDRVREDMKLYRAKGMSFIDILNKSINQTLSRTILTSATTLFVVLVLFIFGGNAINDFAFALIAGVLVGTYSSIFIATPAIYVWENIRSRYKSPSGGGKSGDTKGARSGKRKAKAA